MSRAAARPSAPPIGAHPPSLIRRIVETPAIFRGRDGHLYVSLPMAAAVLAASLLAAGALAELAIAAVKWAVPA